MPTALASPSAFTLYESRMNLEGVLVVGISQSGESQDVLETIRRSGELGANTLTVTNDEGSAMAKVGQHHFFLRTGREASVAATKTYTAELLAVHGSPADLGGYYYVDKAKTDAVMRPSETFNRALAEF